MDPIYWLAIGSGSAGVLLIGALIFVIVYRSKKYVPGKGGVYIPRAYDAYPDFEHGHMFPTKKKHNYIYDDNFRFRVSGFKMKFLQLFARFIILILPPILIPLRYGVIYKNRKVFRVHKKELKNGFITTSNHVFPWDMVGHYVGHYGHFPEFPIWKEGAESKDGYMYRLGGGIPMPHSVGGVARAFRAMNDVVKEGKWLHIYPEAACWYYYSPIREFKEGVWKIAYDNNKPIIPIAIVFRKPTGIWKLIKHKEPLAAYVYGEPQWPNYNLPKKESMKELGERIHLQTVQLIGMKDEQENIELKKKYKYYKYIPAGE